MTSITRLIPRTTRDANGLGNLNTLEAKEQQLFEKRMTPLYGTMLEDWGQNAGGMECCDPALILEACGY